MMHLHRISFCQRGERKQSVVECTRVVGAFGVNGTSPVALDDESHSDKAVRSHRTPESPAC